MVAPTVGTILTSLPKSPILETGRRLEFNLVPSHTKGQLASAVEDTRLGLRSILPLLRRDKLRAACRAFGLDDEARARDDLIETLAVAAGEAAPTPDLAPPAVDGLPKPDDIVVVVRQRQDLVEAVTPSAGLRRPRTPPQGSRVSMVCLDDDARGRCEVPWELEIGARVIEPACTGLSGGTGSDSAAAFRGNTHALRGNYTARADCVVRYDQACATTFNQVKDPDCTTDEIEHLRRLHEAMDRAVLDAYGWSDIEVPPYGTADPEAQQAFEDEVIDRLFVLNAERAAEEAATAKPPKPKRSKKPPIPDELHQPKLL